VTVADVVAPVGARPKAATARVSAPAAVRSVDLRRVLASAALGLSLWLIGFFLVAFFLTGPLQRHAQTALAADLAELVADPPDEALNAPVPHGAIARIEAEGIDLSQVVVEGSSPSELAQGPGHLRGSSLPGEFGNAVLVGHRLIYGAPFRHLDRLERGDEIVVTTYEGQFTYKVFQVRSVEPGEPDVIGASLDSRLTLTTSESATGSGRLVVEARLDGKPVGVPVRPTTGPADDELGVSGDLNGLLVASLWLELLVLGVFFARWAYRRLPPRAAYLLTTPVLFVGCWLAYSNFSRFLPGTL
jgi:sortase A